MATSHQPVPHFATFGMDYQTKPQLVDDGKWRIQFGMRNKDGKLTQVPRKVVHSAIHTNHNYTIKCLAAVPAGGHGLCIPFALTDKAAYAFDSGGFRQLFRGFKRSNSQYLRWGTCLYNEFLYFVNPNNSVYYTDGSKVMPLGPDVPMGRYVDVFFEHLVVANCSKSGVVEPTCLRWSSLYDFTNFTAAQTNEADHYDFADYGRGDCGSVGLSGLKRLGEQLFVFTPTYIAGMQYVGLPTVMRVGEPVVKDVGNSYPYSMAATDKICFFVDENARSFFVFDGVQAVDVGRPVSDWFFSQLSTVPEERFRTYAYIDPLYKEVHWVYVSQSGGGRFDQEVVFNYEEKTWYAAPVEDLHAFLPATKVAATFSDTKADSAISGLTSDPDVYGYKETLPRLWGFRNGRLLREATNSDNLDTCLYVPAPYLETPDYMYKTLQNVKEISSVTIHANVKNESNAGVDVTTSARSQIDETVSMQTLGQWTPLTPSGRFGGLNTAGRVHRHRFSFSSLATTTTHTDTFVSSAFVAKKFNGPVTAIAIAPSGKVYVGGYFDKYNGVACNPGLVLLNTNGTIDSTFNPPDFYINGTWPVPSQIIVGASSLFVAASRSYMSFRKATKTPKNFGFTTNAFGASWETDAYNGPPLVKMSLTTGAVDTAFADQLKTGFEAPPKYLLDWNNANPALRPSLLAVELHTSGRLLVSTALSGYGILALVNESTGAVLHYIDSVAALMGREPGVAMDVKCLSNGDVMFIHQDQGSGTHMKYPGGADVFDELPKQGAMLHVLQVANDTFSLDTLFVAASKWEFQVGGDNKYGLADFPFRMNKELLTSSPVVATLSDYVDTSPALAGAEYAGKWGPNAPGTQSGMCFWHGDPYEPTKCWSLANGTFNEEVLSANGFISNVTPLWTETKMAEPIAVLGSNLESLSDGLPEEGVGVYVTGCVSTFKAQDMAGYCMRTYLSDGTTLVSDAGFYYYPLFKVGIYGEIDANFAQHLFEYKHADDSSYLIAGLEFAAEKYPGRVLCAAVFSDKAKMLVGGMFTRIDATTCTANFVLLDALTGEVLTNSDDVNDNTSTVSYILGGGVRDAVFSGFEENVRMGGER